MEKLFELNAELLSADLDKYPLLTEGREDLAKVEELVSHLRRSWSVEAVEFFRPFICAGTFTAEDENGTELWRSSKAGLVSHTKREHDSLLRVFDRVLQDSFMYIGALRLLKVEETTIKPSNAVFGNNDELIHLTPSELFTTIQEEFEKRITTRQSRLNEQITLYLKAFEAAGITPPKLPAPKKRKK